MATVRMLQSMAGADFVRNRGDEVAIDDVTAARFVAAGVAEYVSPPAPKVERAANARKIETRG